jgi:hypothetical protein
MRSSYEIEKEYQELRQRVGGLMDVKDVKAYKEAIRLAKESEYFAEEEKYRIRVRDILEGGTSE